ncbi:MAG: hypothetical protein HC880_13045 [Bacteroidia bacterium]|nr:hypothetical protein [Bacteroidia bacterium]
MVDNENFYIQPISIPHVPYVFYIIVVHGIGEQKLNSTVTPVINRLAEVRQQQNHPKIDIRDYIRQNIVSLGMVTAQTGHPYMKEGRLTFANSQPWAEFANIRSDAKIEGNFEARPSRSGDNIRFVELFWADILNESFTISGQDLRAWSDTLLGRVAGRATEDEQWMLRILEQLRSTLLFLSNILTWQSPAFRQLIFDKFLGDVQMYGENPLVRAKSVARFHNLFEKLERKHYEREGSNPRKPQYIIVAHSLGSLLAADALIYGHLKAHLTAEDLPRPLF